MADRDRSPVWHPFTQHAVAPPPIEIARADGAWLESADGRRLIDAISSWWVTTHGHRHPRIMAAIRAATDNLDQIIFAGLTHAPAEQLARELIAIAPPGLAHVFFTDSGSTSVEVALKMALGTFANRGEKRHTVVALQHAYHGDTVGAMSAGARGAFTSSYEPLLFEVERIPFPTAGKAQATIDAFEQVCRRTPVAALIVEPLILGAGGMLMYPPTVLRELRRVCDAHGVLLIADEVMTGWGRTGTLFACEQAGVAPDILCLGKGITGGALPLAVTLATPSIFDAHYSTDRLRTFWHSSSYTANPLACAAALANLAVWREEPVLERITTLCQRQEARIAPFRDDARFSDVRRCGTITALDVNVPAAGYLSTIGPKMYEAAIASDVLLRPLGNTLYVMPPYCITASELDQVYAALGAAVAAGSHS
jgi:adenosylmethionine-8-amino-7-oxononanoate aminotransferase